MSIASNIATFENWPLFYAGRWGLLRREFEIVVRSGPRIRVRPHTDDLKILKSNFVTDHYIRDFVPLVKNSIVVDIGAHIGCFSIRAAALASRVLAFEPEPDNFSMLTKNIELNRLKNVSAFQTAVSGASGFEEFATYSDGSTGSHSLCHQAPPGANRNRVQTISLGEVIQREGLSRIDFLKLDCEGAEHAIFRNMDRETARKISCIAMETHGLPGSSPESPLDIPHRLRELGFDIRVEQNGGYVYARRTPRRD